MFDDTKDNDIVPALLENGESVIPENVAERLSEFLEGPSEKKEDVVEKTVKETKSEKTAKKTGTRAKVVEAPQTEPNENVISSVPKKRSPKSALADIEGSSVIGSTSASRKDYPANAKIKTVTEDEKVAVFSTKNVTWNGVGKVYRGYNIVSHAEAEKWLTRNHIRMATPAEVAEEFGTK
jgi:hypothetical protein